MPEQRRRAGSPWDGASWIVLAVLFLAPGCQEESPEEPETPTPAGLSLRWEHETGSDFPLSLVPDALGRGVLFVAAKSGGVQVLQTTTNGATEVARIGGGAFGNLDAMYVAQDGDRLYVALGDFFAAAGSATGLAVLDVSDATQPAVLGTWISTEVGSGSAVLAVDGDRVYLGAMREGVWVFDVARPAEVERIAVFQPDPDFPVEDPSDIQHPNARGLALDGNHLYVCYDAGGLRVLDVSDPSAIVEIGRYLNEAVIPKQQAYNSVIVDGGRGFLAVDYCGIEIVDLTNPAEIVPLAWLDPWDCTAPGSIWFNSPGHTSQIAFDAEREILWASAGDSEILGIDVTNPTVPAIMQRFGERSDGLGAWSVAYDQRADEVYVGYIRALVPFVGNWAGVRAFLLGSVEGRS